jgi:hypothetical protein
MLPRRVGIQGESCAAAPPNPRRRPLGPNLVPSAPPLELVRPLPDGLLDVYPLSTKINSSRVEGCSDGHDGQTL